MFNSSPSATPSASVSGLVGSRPRSASSASGSLSASRSPSLATVAVSVVSGAGSATGAGSLIGSGATTGAGGGAGFDTTAGGPITVIPAPGLRSPQVIVQSPALTPVELAEGAVAQEPSTFPVIIGAPFIWAIAPPCTLARPRLRPTVATISLFTFIGISPCWASLLIVVSNGVRTRSGALPSLSTSTPG